MTFLINNITTVALITALLIHLIYWIVDKIKTKGDIEKLRKEMQDGVNGVRTEMKDTINDVNKKMGDAINDVIKKMEVGIDGVKRHDKNNQQNSVNIVSELLKIQEENNEERIKGIETKIENIEKKLNS